MDRSRSSPAGFRTVAELIRTMGGTGGVGHIVLSDGLAAISVFIEPATSRQPRRNRVWCGRRDQRLHAPGGQLLGTVVGEAPAESVKYIANAGGIPQVKAGDLRRSLASRQPGVTVAVFRQPD